MHLQKFVNPFKKPQPSVLLIPSPRQENEQRSDGVFSTTYYSCLCCINTAHNRVEIDCSPCSSSYLFTSQHSKFAHSSPGKKDGGRANNTRATRRTRGWHIHLYYTNVERTNTRQEVACICIRKHAGLK